MPQVIEQQGSPLGRLGKGIGKGLADTIPKEIDRYRLASGLEKFEKESKGKSPFQQAVDFYKIPGATAEMGYTLFPLLQNEQRNAAAGKFGEGKEGQQKRPGATNVQVTAMGDEGNLKPYRKGQMPSKQAEMGSLKPRSSTEAQTTPYVKPSADQMYQEAVRRHQENPGLYKTPEEALPLVQANAQAEEANYREQQSAGLAQDAVKAKVLGSIEQAWAKEKTLAGIPGTMQSKIFEKAENELANGTKSEKEIISEARDAGKEIAQAHTNLTAAKPSWFESPKNIRTALPNIRKTFEKYDGLEEFQDLLSGELGFSPQIAARRAYPLNKQEKTFIKDFFDVPGTKPEYDAESLSFFNEYNPEQVKKSSVAFADDIADFAHEGTSVLSLIAEAQRNHLSPQIIIKRLSRNMEDGLWTPNDRQQRELQKVIPDLPTLGDFYISLMLDEDEMVE